MTKLEWEEVAPREFLEVSTMAMQYYKIKDGWPHQMRTPWHGEIKDGKWIPVGQYRTRWEARREVIKAFEALKHG